jgi:hypothetical protein
MRRFAGVSAVLTVSLLLLALAGLPAGAHGQGSGVDVYTEDAPGGGGGGGGGGGSSGGSSGGGGGAATTDSDGAAVTSEGSSTASEGSSTASEGSSTAGTTTSGLAPSVADETDASGAAPVAEPIGSGDDNGDATGDGSQPNDLGGTITSGTDHGGGVPLGDVLRDTAGGSGSGGLGLAMPIILGVTLLVALAILVARLRGGGLHRP